ncbi:KAP family P-loop NTPase fold protein [Brevundimonas sp.]|uniref:KAP family P-loop NTPase fold protein n=1 Tax=Brevundimonas sp. TaxID=1871086 RepID=UPI003F725C70
MWRDSESKDDFLNFTELADQVATLATTPDLLPISIGVFGGWGTGKSTVLTLVEGRIPREGPGAPLIVHFDAWLYQGLDDAKAALMEVISTDLLRLAESKKTLVDKAKSFAGRINYFRGLGLIADFGIGMALGIPPGLMTRAGAAVSSIVSGGEVSAESYGELKTDAVGAKKALSDLIRPETTRTPPEEIAAFRREFGELLEGLDTTLIVFIDNLDRCLPDVAISTLEAVRLFLFMPRTAFVIAADEDMIRHSVARHFSDPNVAHVRDYLDKVIQVPLRVPQVGPEDLRAYMYSLFVAEAAPDKLAVVQARLLKALQGAWAGDGIDKLEIFALAGGAPDLLDKLSMADRLAPILAWAPNVQGNPRIVKRLLNAVSLRRVLAAHREMNVDFATLAKLAVFERCTDGPATLALFRVIMDGDDPHGILAAPETETPGPPLPPVWTGHVEFIEQWRRMEPLFKDPKDLRPAVFLSRDVMAPAPSRSGLSDAAAEAVEALLKVSSINSPAAAQIIANLSTADRRSAMSQLIDAMRPADWSGLVPGLHGAILLSQASVEAATELKAFIGGLQVGKMHKGGKFLLKQAKLIEG